MARRITSLAPWFGGKRTLAPKIVELLGPHEQYFEPFCGSMAVLLAKPPSRHETANDLHDDLVNLARVIQRHEHAVELYDRLQRTLICEQLLKDAQDFLIESDWQGSVERAYWYFLASWMGRNGVSGTEVRDYQIATRWTPRGGSGPVRFRSAVESLPWWHERLRNVTILSRDAFDILPKIEDAAHTAIYVDPPYCRESMSGGARYMHDFPDARPPTLFGEQRTDQHERLRDNLSRFKHAKVVVSYYDCDRIRRLYAAWRFIDAARQKNLNSQNKRGAAKSVAPEVLIVSQAVAI